jgi:hypothetical protein
VDGGREGELCAEDGACVAVLLVLGVGVVPGVSPVSLTLWWPPPPDVPRTNTMIAPMNTATSTSTSKAHSARRRDWTSSSLGPGSRSLTQAA